jgi:hypothetical protein
VTGAILRSVRFPDGSVKDGLNLPVVERGQFVDPVSRELLVHCSLPHPVFSEPYDLAVEACRIEVTR